MFELPSLGGDRTVRGFQYDDALGRKLWSLQSELWTPLPGTLNASGGNAAVSFLKQNVRLAGFADVGGIGDAYRHSTPGLRKGVGGGIRFIQGLIALKVDWAYGFGQGAFGKGHGRFYIGVATNGGF